MSDPNPLDQRRGVFHVEKKTRGRRRLVWIDQLRVLRTLDPLVPNPRSEHRPYDLSA